MNTLSATASKTDEYRAIDQKLARQVLAYEQAQNPQASLSELAALVQQLSHALGKGQVCLPVTQEQGHELAQYQVVYAAQSWQNTQDYANQPLVLANHKLYFARYYFYETALLTEITQRTAYPLQVDLSALQRILNQLFPSSEHRHIDWQKVAAASSCLQHFTLITGGPGTGKTTTVTKLLSALLELNPKLNIALAAPTGKAAARMTESIREAKHQLSNLFHRELIPESSFTLHRLLGWRPQGFKYHKQQPLPYDCVVVDEASMIDLPMMSHLFAALGPRTKLILLGDRDQLASVEVGSVLADLCDAGVEHGPSDAFAAQLQQVTGYDLTAVAESQPAILQNALAQLKVSYRFHADSGIGNLARAVNEGAAQASEAVFNQYPQELQWLELPAPEQVQPWYQRWQQPLLEGFHAYAQAVQQQHSAQQVFAAFSQFQVLVAVRKGVCGVEQANRMIAALLQRHGLLSQSSESNQWYPGRAIMITENNYDLGLFNGDIGIAMVHEQCLRVAFLTSEGGVRWLLPSRVPSHETAFAITVHKSQGSEFKQVLLLLPHEPQVVITRELIYTAITRAKERFTLISNHTTWRQGLALQVQRASGLREILWPTTS